MTSPRRIVRIIGLDNGRGLTRHREILAAAFERSGWGVCFSDPRRLGVTALVSVNIHLESLAIQCLPTAPRNIVVPNPEWFTGTSALSDPSVRVWAATEDAARIFRGLGARVEHIGFRSADRLDADVLRQRAFFHVGGMASPNKGTQTLISCWKKEWPRLTVVSAPKVAKPNVTVMQAVSDQEIRRLQNAHLFHICPSRYEGFGHAQWEGLSCGAIVFATDGPPFDEHRNTFSLLAAKTGKDLRVSFAKGEPDLCRRIPWRDVTAEAIAEAVAWTQTLSDNDIATQRALSRTAWERNASLFETRIDAMIGALGLQRDVS